MYYALSITALCFEAGLIAFFIICSLRNNSSGGALVSGSTVFFLIPAYLLLVYLYLVGFSYTGEPWNATAVVQVMAKALQTFTLEIGLDYVIALAEVNVCYTIAVILALIIALGALIFSAIAIFGDKLRNRIAVKRALRGDIEFVCGTCKDAVEYAEHNGAMLVADLNNDDFRDLIYQKLLVARKTFLDAEGDGKKDFARFLEKSLKKGKMYHFIMFRADIDDYAGLIERFVTTFGKYSDCGFTLHLEAGLTETDVINRKFIDANRCENLSIKCFSKHELIARKFIIDHPISKYLPEDFYGEHRAILPNKKINVILLGFGKINYELMKLMIIQNQFVGVKKNRFVNHPVNYYAFDSQTDKLVGDIALRIAAASKNTASDPPEPICHIADMHAQNVKSPELVDRLEKIVCDPDAFSYIIVSIGSDLENVAYAEHLNDVFSAGDHAKIFARMRSSDVAAQISDEVVCFGGEKAVLTRDIIINETLDDLSREVNDMYDARAKKKIQKYNSKHTVEIYSNIYNTLSVFFKINLLGLQFVKQTQLDGTETTVTKPELEDRFGEIDRTGGYDKYFSLSVWNMLGFSEHSRWVAQYILDGYRQMKLSDIKVNLSPDKKDISIVSKNHARRTHCCITDYYGLDKYHKHLLKLYHDNGFTDKTIDDVETYCYDYMFVDSVYEKMINAGYVLIKKP